MSDLVSNGYGVFLAGEREAGHANLKRIKSC